MLIELHRRTLALKSISRLPNSQRIPELHLQPQ